VVEFLLTKKFKTVLDVPSGNGWLYQMLPKGTDIDGIDLFENKQEGYRDFWQHDLDEGLPSAVGKYDLICYCEGIEHVGNPLLLLRSFYNALNKGGMIIVTTPNIWYPQSRLQFLVRGFFPSFPSLVDSQINFGSHMHIPHGPIATLSLFIVSGVRGA
jgi:2-polyprenyl-3-methyl-5-hydroxy-6-metoxy-1,4-benzoquinol methylase